MKTHYLLPLFLLLVACAGKKESKVEEVLVPPSSTTLLARLQNVVDSGKFIYGHSDDTAYGHTWEYEAGRSDVKEVVGDYPGHSSAASFVDFYNDSKTLFAKDLQNNY